MSVIDDPNDRATVEPAPYLTGRAELPADKSIAHRTAMLAALGDGESRIVHFPGSADPQSTLSCVRALGIPTSVDAEGVLHVFGRGPGGLRQPEGPLDCGNSGTTMRLFAGILAGQRFDSELTGDASLSGRPMRRVQAPLEAMGARIELVDGHAPMRVAGSRLRGIEYELPVASAQVKSCVLLAGLFAEGTTTVVETVPSRDHTERMLGLDAVEIGGKRYLSVEGGRTVGAGLYVVPGDFSAAAFLLVAGSIVREAALVLPGVGMNPTRTGLLEVLRAMGARIVVSNERTVSGEPVADLLVRSSGLTGVTVGGSIIPNLVDEIPILAVAATQAEGRTVISDAGELRVKESDRLAALARGLTALGARVEERPDGLVIDGPTPLVGSTVEAFGDHRIAMAMGIAGLVASGSTTIRGASSASVSFPGFWALLDRLSGRD